jgi:hypothetical protein
MSLGVAYVYYSQERRYLREDNHVNVGLKTPQAEAPVLRACDQHQRFMYAGMRAGYMDEAAYISVV